VTAAVQLWRAADDKITPNEWNADIVRDARAKPPEDHLVPKAGHFDFIAPCSEALAKVAAEICTTEPGFDRAALPQETNKAIVVMFFEAKLRSP